MATTLVDSGSDVSFMNVKFAIKTGCEITTMPKAQVTADNGRMMTSETGCQACPYEIQGHKFVSDFTLLDVQGYDIILGADWIYHHSPISLNLKTI